MRNATLTITVENIQTDERIMICGYTPRLKDIVTPGQTIVAIGMLRLTKDGLGVSSLTLNINQAMQVTLPVSVTV
jgi:hypothetical protein